MKGKTSRSHLRIATGAITLFGFSFTALGFQYVVRPGDVLSRIAQKSFEGRVFGEKGSLKRVLALNPEIKNPNLIYSGQKLILREETIKKVARAKSELHKSEVFPAPNVDIIEVEGKKVKSWQISNKHFSAKEDAGRVPAAAIANEAVNTESVNTQNRYSTISLIPKLSYHRFSGTDTTNNAPAKLYSSESYGADLAWKQHWSNTFATSLELKYQSYKFQETSNRSLSDSSVSTAQIGLGIESRFSESWLLYSSLYYGSYAYLYAPSGSALRVDKANALSNNTGLKYKLADLSPFSFSIFGGGSVTAATDVDTYRSKVGYAGHLGIDITHTLKSGTQIKGIFEVDHGVHDTNPVQQSHDNMSLGIGIVWRPE